jgi:hypothetical protein
MAISYITRGSTPTGADLPSTSLATGRNGKDMAKEGRVICKDQLA